MSKREKRSALASPRPGYFASVAGFHEDAFLARLYATYREKERERESARSLNPFPL